MSDSVLQSGWTLDELFAYGKKYVAGQVRHMENPDDDWNSYLWVTGGPQDDDDGRRLITLSVDVPDSERKELYASAIPKMVRETKARLALLLLKSMSKNATGEFEEAIVIAFTAREIRYADAAVTRDGVARPQLGPWTDHGDYTLLGRLVEPLRKALVENAMEGHRG